MALFEGGTGKAGPVVEFKGYSIEVCYRPICCLVAKLSPDLQRMKAMVFSRRIRGRDQAIYTSRGKMIYIALWSRSRTLDRIFEIGVAQQLLCTQADAFCGHAAHGFKRSSCTWRTVG